MSSTSEQTETRVPTNCPALLLARRLATHDTVCICVILLIRVGVLLVVVEITAKYTVARSTSGRFAATHNTACISVVLALVLWMMRFGLLVVVVEVAAKYAVTRSSSRRLAAAHNAACIGRRLGWFSSGSLVEVTVKHTVTRGASMRSVVFGRRTIVIRA